MKKILYLAVCVVLFVLSLFLIQVERICEAIKNSTPNQQPFVRNNPQARLRMLFVGDSTALGTGAATSAQSVAGWFGQDFPDAAIDNKSANGKRIAQLDSEFPPYPGRNYDLTVIQIGANDIMRFSSFKSVDVHLSSIIHKAKAISKQVVILHSGNVGLAPVFVWPFDWIMTYRARQMRALYIQKAREEKVHYIDLFTERDNDLFLKDIPFYYSKDHLHPSGEGYRWWYQKIRMTLDQAKVVL